MLRPGSFQGAGAFRRRGARGVHVVEEEDLPGDPPSRGDGERPPDVSFPEGKREGRLGKTFPGPQEEEGIERPSCKAGQPASHQRGEVESPPEIFPGKDRDRDDHGTATVREQVRPLLPYGREHPLRDRARRRGHPPVFCGPDRLADLSLVGEEGAGGREGRVARAVGAGTAPLGVRDKYDRGKGAAPGAAGSPPGGPPRDRSAGKPGPRGRKEGLQRREQGRRAAGEPGKVSGPWRGWRIPSCRGRWSTRSRCRRWGTGEST